jgi:hypothetical protein
MKYAKYVPNLKRRETWTELVTRNKEMHQAKFPQLTKEIEAAKGDDVLVQKLSDKQAEIFNEFAKKATSLGKHTIFSLRKISIIIL